MPDGQVVENTSEVAVAPAQTGQVAPAPSETLEGQSGQANPQGQSASTEESFSSIDPKTLPQEMQSLHKSLQADYTKKMQSIADSRKKAEAYDKLSNDQNFRDYWSGLNRQQKAEYQEKKQEAEKTLGQKISDDDFSKAFESKDAFLQLIEKVAEDKNAKAQKEIQELQERLSVQDASNIVESFATELGPDGKQVRPDFYSLDEDQLISGYLGLNPPEDKSQGSYISKLNEAYSWARNMSQKYYEKGKAEAFAAVQKKAAASTQMPTNSAKSVYSGKDPKQIDHREAFELAKKGIKIPQVYD